MQVTLVRQDIEGDLVEIADGGPAHLAKRLSTAVAWHVFDPGDLTNVTDTVVDDVSLGESGEAHFLHYRPGIERFDFASLRQALMLDTPLGPWMAAILASDLCASLKALHDEDIPQLVLHPERVGRLGGKYTVLPTLPGILPPYSLLQSGDIAYWLRLVAPEALRTRGIDKSLLFSADVYALGRMLLLLCAPDWQPDVHVHPRKLAEQCVERSEDPVCPDLPPAFDRLASIWRRAASLLPTSRPAVAEFLKQLETARDELSPEETLERLLHNKRLAEAESFLALLEKARAEKAIPLTERAWHIMAADLCMARVPPDAGKAIVHLEHAAGKNYEAAIDLRLARAYRHFTANPNHLRLSSDSYQIAAALLNWPPDIVDEWMAVLRQIGQADYVHECVESIGFAHRTPSVDLLWVDQLVQQQNFLDAWYEVAPLLREGPLNQALFQKATDIASHLDATVLAIWLDRFQDDPEFAAPLAIVWNRLGEQELAEHYLAEARKLVPRTGA